MSTTLGSSRGGLRRRLRRQRDQLARRRGAAREGRLALLRARAERLARRRDQDRRRPRRARVHARGLQLVASALDRLAGLRRAEAGPRPARRRVPQHRAPDGLGLPGRLERLPHHGRRRERTPSYGEAWQRQFDEFMGNADIAFGVLGTELWSGSGLGLGRKAYSPARPPRPRRVQRPGARRPRATG